MKLEILNPQAYKNAFQKACDTDTVNDLSVIIADMLTWSGDITISVNREYNLSFSHKYANGNVIYGGIIYHAASNTWAVHT